jgi:hypothetical protein
MGYRIPTATEAAQVRGTGAQRARPRVVTAHFDVSVARIVLELDRQCSIAFDPAVYPYLSAASGFELEEIEVLGAGAAINFPRLDISLSLENLIADLLAPFRDQTDATRVVETRPG